MSVRITLPCGRIASVDDEDFGRVAHLRWRSERIKQRAERYYAYAYIGKRKVYLHRLVMQAPQGITVDHRDNDGLNNCRENLRLATRSQNNANRAAKSMSGYRGVFAAGKKFVAHISDRSCGGKNRRLGRFATAEEAARAYDKAAAARFGEFARLNFPQAIT